MENVVNIVKSTKRISYRLDLAGVLGADVRCNMDCKWCHKDFFPVAENIEGRLRLPFDKAIELIESVMPANPDVPRVIHLSGRAEPLLVGPAGLVEHLAPLAPRMAEWDSAITTNGLLLGRCATTLRAVGIRRVNLSASAALVHRCWKENVGAAQDAGLKVSLNYLVHKCNDDAIRDATRFAGRQGVSVKFFALLGMTGEEIDQTMERVSLVVAEETGCRHRYDGMCHRHVFEVGAETSISVKLRSQESPRRAVTCSMCPALGKCTEGCWESIRITPWYVKPCGVREDNVYFFDTNDPQVLLEELRKGGKVVKMESI